MSLGKVARHIAEAEEGWFRYAVTRELAKWPEFRDEDMASIASLRARLTEVHVPTEAFLATVDRDDRRDPDAGSVGPETVIETPWGEKLALHWIILHVLEHEIHHRGEIYLMLGILGLDAPDFQALPRGASAADPNGWRAKDRSAIHVRTCVQGRA